MTLSIARVNTAIRTMEARVQCRRVSGGWLVIGPALHDPNGAISTVEEVVKMGQAYGRARIRRAVGVLILTGQIEATPEAAKVAQYTLIRKMREGIGGVDELVDAFIEARESYQPGDGWDPRTPA